MVQMKVVKVMKELKKKRMKRMRNVKKIKMKWKVQVYVQEQGLQQV